MRRARIIPGKPGYPRWGHRRVPGLRREEVALLAGVSIDYYTRLERGSLAGASKTQSPIIRSMTACVQGVVLKKPDGDYRPGTFCWMKVNPATRR